MVAEEISINSLICITTLSWSPVLVNYLILNFALHVMCSETGIAVEILQTSSRVSLLPHTHTHTGTYETRRTRICAHKTHKKNDTDTQVTRSLLLTPWLEACRRTGLTTHTLTPCSANLCHTALPVLRSQWLRKKKTKLKNTLLTLVLGCHLTYTECISNSWEYLVSACSILRLHAHPGSHFRLLKACILKQSQAKMNFHSIQEFEL